MKTYCGWSNGVRAVLKKYNLDYEEKDIIKNPAFRWEMEQKSGQDKNEGAMDKAKGRVKEAAGDLTDDDDLKRDGQIDQGKGKVKEFVDDVADKFKS